ncbi:MAG: hypothetical protein WC575_03270, partial [Patescibacteria group bacterium]
VDGFAQVGTDNKCGTPDLADSESRFCGLIDPNWIIRAPTSQCRIKGAGQMLQAESGGRQDTCVDEEQCVAEDEAGNCQSWGYCLAEKNIWRFSGDSCEFPAGSGYSPFATCQTFDSVTGNQLSVLTNSLENYNDGVCSGAASCSWYSRTLNAQESTGSVDRYEQDEANRFYLKNIDKYSCQASEQGCTAFLRLANIDATAVAGASGNNPAEKLLDQVVNVDSATIESTYSSYAKTTKTYLKQAPDYLNCYDTIAAGLANTSNDSEQCKNYLNWCSSYEVGCELYSSQQGAPPVPAIIQAEDFCPNECVGLNSFIQASSFFEPTTTNVDFIPTTAKTCPAQAAGCEEFTNIEQTPSGEQKEYYVKLRQCILLDDPSVATFFTWVGSDLTGFQLKTWRLQSSDINNLTTASPVAPSGDCEADFGTNPDCKQFYSIGGTIFYRLASDVVTASNACSKYRATNVTGPANLPDNCLATNGEWDNNLSACIYHAIPNEGVKCEAVSNGCREYKGPTANNIQLVFPVSTFGDQEQVEGQPVDATPASGWGSGENSNESLNAFGHSFASGVSGADNVVTRYIEKGISPDHRYLITFWVKHYDHTPVVAQSAPVGSIPITASITTLSDDWQFYKIEILSPGDVTGGIFLTIRADQQFVIDNIVMRDLSDTFYVIKNSWNTPSICGAEYLGCSAYTDRSGKTATLTGFSQLCRPEAIGCEPMINTQNSNIPQTITTVVGAPAVDIVTPADSIVYRVYDPAKACADKAEACRLVGQPSLDVSGEVTGWGDKFVRLDPDNFNVNNPTSPLCTKAQDRCQNFTSNKATATFKDPGNSVCEYKQMGAAAEYNWYKKGTNEPCNYLINSSFEKIEDHGNNLVVDGDFEGTLFNWKTDQVNDWSISAAGEQSFLGETSAKHTGNQSNLWQQIRLSPGIAYTARVQVFSTTTDPRTLRIYGCGVDITDTTQTANTWEKLQLTFIPTTSLCTLQLRALEAAYFDSVSIYLAESFLGWSRNGDSAVNNKLVTLSAANSIPGQYWGGQVMEIESSSQMYSGIWSDVIDLSAVSYVDEENIRYFTVSAYFYVPDIPQNSGMIDWWLDVHAIPPDPATPRKSCGGSWRQNYCQTDNDCPIGITCTSSYAGSYHYSVESGTDFIISAADKGKWQYKHLTIKIDPKVEFLSVGIMTNITNPCTADTCKPNQVIYVDQVSNVEGAVQPAYLCSQEQSGCTGFYDPALTQQMYYYLNNDSLDKKSCAGQVSEKAGCMLFADMSNKSVTFNANESYNLSRAATNNLTSPSTAQPADSNIILKVRRDRVCGEWASCLSANSQYDPPSNSIKSICYALGRCTSYGEQGTGKCGNWKIIDNPAPLTYDNYITRNTSWSSYDYSGYSIPGQYPLDTLMQKNYAAPEKEDDIRLTRINPIIRACTAGAVGAADEGKPCTDDDECISGSCAYTLRCGGTSNVACSVLYSSAVPCSADSVCQYQDLGISGQGPGTADEKYPQTVPKLCRVYPKSDSPFPSALASFDTIGNPLKGIAPGSIKSKQQPYQDANICQEYEECECNYKQVTYSQSETRFYSINTTEPVLPAELLVDEGEDKQSAVDNVYSRRKQEDIFLGLKGYCLEKDTTRAIDGGRGNPCLTWLPLDVVSGEISVYDYAPEAGYTGSETFYCSESIGNKVGSRGENYTYHAANGVNDSLADCNVADNDDWLTADVTSQDTGINPNYFCNNETKRIEAAVEDIVVFSRAAEAGEENFYKADIETIHLPFEIFGGWGINPNSVNGALEFNLNKGNNWCAGAKCDWDTSKGLPCDFNFTELADRCGRLRSDILITNSSTNLPSLYGIEHITSPDYDYAVIKAVFDSSNKFLGYNVIYSDGSVGMGSFVIYGRETYLREYCTEAVQVASSISNKAWTDRVIRNTAYQVEPKTELGFIQSRRPSPYGKLSQAVNSGTSMLIMSDKPGVNITSSKGDFSTFPQSFFCENGCGIGFGICLSGQSNGKSTIGKKCNKSADCGESTDALCMGYFNKVCKVGGVRTTQLCLIDNDCNIGGTCTGYQGLYWGTSGIVRVQQLFAKVFNVLTWDTSISRFTSSAVANLDLSGSPLGSLCSPLTNPSCYYNVPDSPSVKQVVFDNNKPLEGTNGFSIRTAAGFFTSDDVEVVSPAAVSTLFYAYNSNGEQMPLTEIRVDWTGNPDMAAGSIGKYKNHKHICALKIIKDASNNDIPNPFYNFGDSTDACVDDSGANQGYFNFTRVLTCTAEGSGLLPCDQANTNEGQVCWDRNALAGEGACVYRPRVLIKDNWEWCASGAYGSACSVRSPAAWLNFDGKILVRP